MIKQGLGLFDTLNMFLRPVESGAAKSEGENEVAYATAKVSEAGDEVSTARAADASSKAPEGESEAAKAAAYATKIANANAAVATKEYLNATVSKRIGEGLLQTEGQRNDQEDKILFMSSNPIDLFIELRKLLAAKKAGHSNTFNQANAIMKYLLEKNYLTTSKYKKILKKYF